MIYYLIEYSVEWALRIYMCKLERDNMDILFAKSAFIISVKKILTKKLIMQTVFLSYN